VACTAWTPPPRAPAAAAALVRRDGVRSYVHGLGLEEQETRGLQRSRKGCATSVITNKNDEIRSRDGARPCRPDRRIRLWRRSRTMRSGSRDGGLVGSGGREEGFCL